MARFYSNENFPLPVVEELRRLGHDVLTIQETGKAGQAVTDEMVLEPGNSPDKWWGSLRSAHPTLLQLPTLAVFAVQVLVRAGDVGDGQFLAVQQHLLPRT